MSIEAEALAALASGKVEAEIERAGDVDAAFAHAASNGGCYLLN